MGSDIKIMGIRDHEKFSITLCIPQIAKYVQSLREYAANITSARQRIEHIIRDEHVRTFDLDINTRDNYALRELYLTAIGSSIESGDEGLAGRGNRVNKLISPTKPMSMEGSCGKNPINHIGKVYYIAAFNLAQKIHDHFGIENEVYLVSQSGRSLIDPWFVALNVPADFGLKKQLESFVKKEVLLIPRFTESILERKISLY